MQNSQGQPNAALSRSATSMLEQSVDATNNLTEMNLVNDNTSLTQAAS